jgi:hypothetical protein
MTRKKLLRACVLGLLAAGLTASAWADVLKLKDGVTVSGLFVGGNESTIQFQVGRQVQQFAIENVASITFTEGGPAASQARPPGAPASAARPPSGLTVPVGTSLMVRNVDPLVTGRAKAGSRVAAVRASPRAGQGPVVLPAGVKVYGRVVEAKAARRIAKRAKLVVTLVEISTQQGVLPIVTDSVGAEGGPGGTVARVGAGALVGAAFGGSSGAGKGAAIGGALSMLTPGSQIQIPPKTLMEFHLTKPLTIR